MEDRTILRTALVTSILGIVCLYIMSRTAVPQTEALLATDDLQLNGTVKNVRHLDEMTFIELKYTSTMPIVVYDHLELVPGSTIEVLGKVNEYKGKRQLVAEIIK